MENASVNAVADTDKKTSWAVWIGLLVLFALAVVFYVYTKISYYNNGIFDDIYGSDGQRKNAEKMLITDGMTLETTFSTDYAVIRGIALQFDYDEAITPDGSVNAALYDGESGALLQTINAEGAAFSRTTYSTAGFDSMLNNTGKTYRLVITFSGFENQEVYVLMESGNPCLAVITAGKDNFYSIFNLSYIILLAVFVIAVIGLYTTRLKKYVKVEHVYLLAGLAVGLIYALWIPVGAAPDEPRHMYTAYQMSNHLMGIEDAENGYVKMRADDADFLIKIEDLDREYIDTFYEGFFSGVKNTGMVDVNCMIVGVKKYLYVPTALGITLGRVLGFGTAATLLLGRLFNMLVFVWAVYYSIKKMPFAKTVLFVWALLPIVLQQSASYSYDSPILTMCVLITALTLRFLYDDSKAKKSEIIIYAAALILLLPCKSFSLIPVVAFALALVPKLLRKHHISIKSFNKKAVIISVAILAVVFAAAVIVAVKYFTAPERINSNYISWANHTGYTVGYFIQNPNRLVGILIETLMASGDAILLQALGCGLGWLDMSASVLFVLVYVLLLVFASMRKENEDVYIKAGTRAYMWILAAGVCGLAAFAMLIEWTPNTSSLINGLQGRYFIPVIPLALIACRSSHTCTREDSDRIIMMLAVYTQVFLLASVIRNYI